MSVFAEADVAFAGRLPLDSGILSAVLCHRGERHLDTIYSENRVRENFGDVSRLPD